MSSMKKVFGDMKKALSVGNFTLVGLVQLLQNYTAELEQSEGSGGGATDADEISYDNTASGLAGDNVQEAIDEVVENVGDLADLTTTAKTDLVSAINEVAESGGGGATDADEISYDNTASGLTATNVQDAIDENAGTIGDLTDLDTTVKTDLVSAINEVAGSAGGFTYELVHSSNISITDNGSVTISLTKKYTNPYLFCCSALPGSSWGGLIYVTNVTYDSTNDELTFTTFTNTQQVYTGVDWFIFEQ